MNAVAFSYALLLRGGSKHDQLLQMLPDERRREVKEVLEGLKGISEKELLDRWNLYRAEKIQQLRASFESRTGLALTDISPTLRPWLLRTLTQSKP